MTLLTIFTAPKPFTNPHIAVIQRNAIGSWLQLGKEKNNSHDKPVAPEVQILIIGEEDGLAEIAQQFSLPHLAHVERNPAGTPLVSSIFSLARQASQSPYLAYINADILLFPEFFTTIQRITKYLSTQENQRPFLLIGQRWDLDVKKELDFSAGWDNRLKADLERHGKLHPPAGSDYFVFPRTAFTEMPDFAIGRAGWDNWMIYHARQQGWAVIDGTPTIRIIHQSHDYSHLPGGKPHYDQEESQVNMDMAGGLANMYTVLDANYQWVNNQLRQKPITLLRFVRRLERNLIPKNGELRGFQGGLARRVRRWRRKLERSQRGPFSA